MSHEAKHKAFFRDSAWLMVANLGGGFLMLCVHFLSQKVADYGTVGALLGASIIIPTIPLQMIFAREAAASLAAGNTRTLASKARISSGAFFLFWLAFCGVVAANHNAILEHWKISQPITLWLFLLVILTSLLMPIYSGLLQGKQDFLWLGWVMMLNALLRVSVAALVIFFVPGGNTAAGFMAGVLAGCAAVLLISMWKTKDIWVGASERFAIWPFIREVTPLMIGFGACQVFFSFDVVIVGRFFVEPETTWYASAGTLSRALMWLVLPLVTVMFPKLVHTSAKREDSNLFGLTLLMTASLAILAGIALSLFGQLPVRIVYGQARVAGTMSIIPWFAAAMVPLTLANVLVNNLLAKADFRAVPILAILAIGYGATLWLRHPSLPMVLQTLAAFTTTVFLACAVFTWWFPAKRGLHSPPQSAVAASS